MRTRTIKFSLKRGLVLLRHIKRTILKVNSQINDNRSLNIVVEALKSDRIILMGYLLSLQIRSGPKDMIDQIQKCINANREASVVIKEKV